MTIGSRGVRISGSNAGYTVLRGSVKSTGYTLHSPVTPSLPPTRASTCAITFQLEPTGLLAGHKSLRCHLYIMGLIDSPLWRRYAAEQETSVLCTSDDTRAYLPGLLSSWVRSVSLRSIWNIINPLALELDIYSLAHHLCTM